MYMSKSLLVKPSMCSHLETGICGAVLTKNSHTATTGFLEHHLAELQKRPESMNYVYKRCDMPPCKLKKLEEKRKIIMKRIRDLEEVSSRFLLDRSSLTM
jgi:hypothetical protein